MVCCLTALNLFPDPRFKAPVLFDLRFASHVDAPQEFMGRVSQHVDLIVVGTCREQQQLVFERGEPCCLPWKVNPVPFDEQLGVFRSKSFGAGLMFQRADQNSLTLKKREGHRPLLSFFDPDEIRSVFIPDPFTQVDMAGSYDPFANQIGENETGRFEPGRDIEDTGDREIGCLFVGKREIHDDHTPTFGLGYE